MLARLAAVWHPSSGASQTPETAARILSALGPVGTAFLLKHAAVDDEFAKSFVKFFSGNRAAILQTSTLPFSVKAAAGDDAAIQQQQQSAAQLQKKFLLALAVESNLLETICGLHSQFCCRRGTATAAHSSPDALAEMLGFASAVYRQPASKLLVLTALSACCGDSEDATSAANGALVVTSLVRHAVALLHQQQQQQQQQGTSSTTLDISEFAPAMIRAIVDVLNVVKNSNPQQQQQQHHLALLFQADTFLLRIAAPLLSQFGFEFLWRFCADSLGGSGGSRLSPAQHAARNLLHYCQRLSYAERMRVVAPHQQLRLQLLPEVPFDCVGASGSWVPKWWADSFRELAGALTPLDAEAAASVFRRYRFAAKVVASSSVRSAAGNDDADGDEWQSAVESPNWVGFYASALNNRTARSAGGGDGNPVVPAEISLRLQQAVGAPSSSSSAAADGGGGGVTVSAAADPLMVACFFLADKSSCSFNGRRETLRRLSVALGGNDSSSTAFQQQQGPFWTIAACLVLDNVVAAHNEEADESPLEAQLFSAVVVEMLLQRLETLAAAGHLSPVRLGTLVCGWAASGIRSAASSFRGAFSNFGFVQRSFAAVLRAAWSTASAADDSAKKFALGELVSLATVVATRCFQLTQQQQQQKGEDDDDDGEDALSAEERVEEATALAKVVCCVAREWHAALSHFGGLHQEQQEQSLVNQQQSDELSAVGEVLERCAGPAQLYSMEARRLFLSAENK